MKTIKTTCPVCNHEIEDENMIPEEDYAFCTVCQKEFNFTDFFIVPDTDAEKQETTRFTGHYQPRKTWIHEKRDGVIIGAVARSIVKGLLLFIPAIICFFFAIFIVFFNSEGFSIGYVFAGIFVLFFFLLFAVFGSIFLLDKVEIGIGIGKESYIYRKQGVLGATKEMFEWNSVVKIYAKTIKVSKKPETFITIKLAEKTVKNYHGKLTNEINFGGALTKKQRQFLLNALQYYHNKKR